MDSRAYTADFRQRARREVRFFRGARRGFLRRCIQAAAAQAGARFYERGAADARRAFDGVVDCVARRRAGEREPPFFAAAGARGCRLRRYSRRYEFRACLDFRAVFARELARRGNVLCIGLGGLLARDELPGALRALRRCFNRGAIFYGAFSAFRWLSAAYAFDGASVSFRESVDDVDFRERRPRGRRVARGG